jgi:hypothetical protein
LTLGVEVEGEGSFEEVLADDKVMVSSLIK